MGMPSNKEKWNTNSKSTIEQNWEDYEDSLIRSQELTEAELETRQEDTDEIPF